MWLDQSDSTTDGTTYCQFFQLARSKLVIVQRIDEILHRIGHIVDEVL
jgi:hypothetical protein